MTEVRVGVTGHRILTDIDPLVAGVRQAVELVLRSWPGRTTTVVSALAEGADRIVVEELLRLPGARLIVVLPFDAPTYAKDFGCPGSPSRLHFRALLERAAEVDTLAPSASTEEAYARVGEAVLDRCDVLFALWDGEVEQGRGGTAEIVRRARTVGKPLVIIRAGNREPGTQTATTLGPHQGQVLSERLPTPA